MLRLTILENEGLSGLHDLEARADDLASVLRKIGDMGKVSVIRNFAEGGRPTKWKPSIRVLLHGGRTLIDTGRLLASIGWAEPVITPKSVSFGTNVRYAPFHQYGTWKLPPRPFMLLQDQDIEDIREVVREYLMGGQ